MTTNFLLSESDVARFGDFAGFIPLGGQLDLGRGNPRAATSQELSEFSQKFQADDDDSQCCLSAIWLFCDELDRSHSISQSIHTAEGSYLHGIMHRREGDFSNAKYWFRKAGDLEFFAALAKQIQADSSILPTIKVEFSRFDPFLLTDLVCDGSAAEKNSLERITFRELLTVFQHCFDRIP